MRWTAIGLLIALGLPAVTIAQRSTTQPFRGRGDGPGAFGRMGGPAAQIDPAVLEAAKNFAKEHFPNRYRVFEELPPRSPAAANASMQIVRRYNNLMRVQRTTPKAYDALLQQNKLQDQALGFALQFGQDNSDDKLHDTVGQLVDQSLSERQERIEALKKALAEQVQKLAHDQENHEKLVQDQVNNMRNQANDLTRVVNRANGRVNQAFPATAPSGQ